MLHLYDLIRSDAQNRYNLTGTGKRGGRLRVMTSRKGRDQKTIEGALTFPFIKTGKNSYGSRGRLSGETELLARRRMPRRDDDRAVKDLGSEEGLHQLVVEAVA
jgi:hypothetical protein